MCEPDFTSEEFCNEITRPIPRCERHLAPLGRDERRRWPTTHALVTLIRRPTDKRLRTTAEILAAAQDDLGVGVMG